MSDSTGFLALDTIVVWAVAICAVSAGLGAVWALVRCIRRIVAAVDHIVEDWQGTPERPGVPARPGVMQRLDAIERELLPNHGSSLRDAVDRVDRRTSWLHQDDGETT